MYRDTNVKPEAGMGNRMRSIGRKMIRVGKRYRLPMAYLKSEDSLYFDFGGERSLLTCVQKLKSYAVFESSRGNRVCYDYFDVMTMLKNGEAEANETSFVL